MDALVLTARNLPAISLEEVKRFHEETNTWDHVNFDVVISLGRLDVLKYCHEHGCPWGADVTRYAALNNNLEILRYAHENGCSFHPFIVEYARWYADVEMLAYLYECQAPYDCTFRTGSHSDSCEEFMEIYGDAWRSRTFDMPLHCVKPAKP